jgi:glycosyltransferase involved in cell wall biosynthesis
MDSETNPSLLIFAPFFPPVGGPEAFTNGKLVLAFLRQGWDVDVISSFPGALYAGEDDSGCWQPLQGVTHMVSSDATGVVPRLLHLMGRRVLHLQSTGFPVWTLNACKVAVRLLRRKRYSAILSRCYPTWAHFPALVVSLLYGLPWVANWNDPAPISNRPSPYGEGAGKPISLLSRMVFKRMCAQASRHTFPCERLERYMVSYMPAVIRGKTSVIPHIALESAGNADVRETRDALQLCHAGNVYQRPWPEFLEGLRLFVDRTGARERVRVTFVGWQPDEAFDAKIAGLGLEGVVQTLPNVPFEQSLTLMRSYDVQVLIEANLEEGIYLPSKVVDYAATGRPILSLSPRTGTMTDLIGRYGGGVVADCTSPEDIAGALSRLFDSWEKGRLDEDYNPAALRRLFSEEEIMSQYRQLLDDILPGSSSPVTSVASASPTNPTNPAN